MSSRKTRIFFPICLECLLVCSLTDYWFGSLITIQRARIKCRLIFYLSSKRKREGNRWKEKIAFLLFFLIESPTLSMVFSDEWGQSEMILMWMRRGCTYQRRHCAIRGGKVASGHKLVRERTIKNMLIIARSFR